jgi:hypothetical protein
MIQRKILVNSKGKQLAGFERPYWFKILTKRRFRGQIICTSYPCPAFKYAYADWESQHSRSLGLPKSDILRVMKCKERCIRPYLTRMPEKHIQKGPTRFFKHA